MCAEQHVWLSVTTLSRTKSDIKSQESAKLNVRFICKHCDGIRCAIKEKCMGFTKGSTQCDMDENVSESKSVFESQLWSCRTDNNEETEVHHEDNFLIEETLRPASPNKNKQEEDKQNLEKDSTSLEDLEDVSKKQPHENGKNNMNVIQNESNAANKPENRPLGLEERHSLSIAETKKRRASVYSNESLFIPKKLARGELFKRRHCTAVSPLDRISGMLKFRVGSGRARNVAQLLKLKKKSEQRTRMELMNKTSKLEMSIMNESIDLAQTTPLSMPNLSDETVNENQLYSDDECCSVLEEMTLPENKSLNRDAKRKSLSLDLNNTDNDAKQQQLQLFRWHNPDYNNNIIKMGILKDLQQISLTESTEIHVGLTEVQAVPATEASTQQAEDDVVTRDVVSVVRSAEHLSNTSEREHSSNLAATAQDQQQSVATTIEQQQQQQVADVSCVLSCVSTNTTATISFRSHPEPQYTQMPLMQRPMHSENCLEHSISAVHPLNLNLVDQWTMQHCVKYACPQAPPGQQQQPTMWHCNTSYLESSQEELQQLNSQYQRLKYQEDEQLKSINKCLKDVYASRLMEERQHAHYHRIFMHKMVESKKQEEHLQTRKEQLKRQLQNELDHLKQHIAAKQRQLQEHTRTWQWQQLQQQHQQQQQQQQHQHQHQHQQYHHHPHYQYQQQQHFLRQLQPPSYQPRLQCFQDAFAQYAEAPYAAVEPHHRPQPAATSALAPAPPTLYTVPAIAHRPELSVYDRRIMRRRHTIDQRQNHTLPPYGANPAQPHTNLAHATTAMSSSNTGVHRFAIPETTSSSLDRLQVNQEIEQTAITSIISNYVTNYLNDMESRNARTS